MALDLIDGIGVGLAVICLLLIGLVARRRWLARHGGIVEMSLRLRHWTYGVARFDSDRLVWFRTFSLSPRPRRVFDRGRLRVLSRREPHGAERLSVAFDAVVVECELDGERVELGVPKPVLLGFLAWLEAAPTRVATTW